MTLNVSGNVNLAAHSSDEIRAIAASGAVGAAGLSQDKTQPPPTGASFAFTGAGAGADNVIKLITEAYATASTVTTTNGGSISLVALDTSRG